MARKASRGTEPTAPPAGSGSVSAGVAPARPLGRGYAVALGVLLAAYFVLGGLYLATVPFEHAPDEGAHYLYVTQLGRGELPLFRREDRANFEAHQPPLAYVLALPAYALAGGLGEGQAGDAPRVAVRIVSLLLGALVILMVVAGVRLWLPSNPEAALAAGAVAALMPMRLAVFSSFSNDPLTEALYCAALLLLGLGLRDGFSRRRCVGIGGVIGLGLLTKSTCALLVPVALTALFLEWRRDRTRARERVINGALLCGAALVVAGPWMARNTVLYGDPFAIRAFTEFFQDRASPEYWLRRMSFLQYILWWVPQITLRSFWGVFDHMNLWMGGPVRNPPPEMLPKYVPMGSPDAPIYTVLTYVTYALAAGAVLAGVRWWRRPQEGWQRDVALTFGLCAALVGAVFLRFNTQYYQAQARYLYPAVLPIASAMAAGWLAWWPTRAHRAGVVAGAVLLAALALTAWHGTLLRVFGKVGW